MMPTSPRSPPIHSVRRVFPSTAGRLAYQTGPFWYVACAQACSRHALFVIQFASVLRALRGRIDGTALSSGTVGSIAHRHEAEYSAYPRGPRSGPGFSVPVRRHLFDPIRPARRHIAIATAQQLIRDAFAVRERPSDPRAVPGFRCAFCVGMPPSSTTGSSTSPSSRTTTSTRPSSRVEQLGTPKTPAIRFTRGDEFRFLVRYICYGLPAARPPERPHFRYSAIEGFYIQAFGRSVTLPTAGYGPQQRLDSC